MTSKELEKINEIAKETFGEGTMVIKTAERGRFMQLALIDSIGSPICVMDYQSDANCIFAVYSTHSTSLANTVVLRELADFIEKVEGRK